MPEHPAFKSVRSLIDNNDSKVLQLTFGARKVKPGEKVPKGGESTENPLLYLCNIWCIPCWQILQQKLKGFRKWPGMRLRDRSSLLSVWTSTHLSPRFRSWVLHCTGFSVALQLRNRLVTWLPQLPTSHFGPDRVLPQLAVHIDISSSSMSNRQTLMRSYSQSQMDMGSKNEWDGIFRSSRNRHNWARRSQQTISSAIRLLISASHVLFSWTLSVSVESISGVCSVLSIFYGYRGRSISFLLLYFSSQKSSRWAYTPLRLYDDCLAYIIGCRNKGYKDHCFLRLAFSQDWLVDKIDRKPIRMGEKIARATLAHYGLL